MPIPRVHAFVHGPAAMRVARIRRVARPVRIRENRAPVHTRPACDVRRQNTKAHVDWSSHARARAARRQCDGFDQMPRWPGRRLVDEGGSPGRTTSGLRLRVPNTRASVTIRIARRCPRSSRDSVDWLSPTRQPSWRCVSLAAIRAPSTTCPMICSPRRSAGSRLTSSTNRCMQSRMTPIASPALIARLTVGHSASAPGPRGALLRRALLRGSAPGLGSRARPRGPARATPAPRRRGFVFWRRASRSSVINRAPDSANTKAE